jgi:FkbM family methyltransferase
VDAESHHEVFSRFVAACRSVPNWIGVTTRRDFFLEELAFVTVTPPAPDTEYLEWIDVLEAVLGARDRFTMLELGAGYGRWIVNAGVALRLTGGPPHRLVAVEAEPTHFRWLQEHCRDNDVDAELIEAAVASEGGEVDFAVGRPDAWYGQAIADGTWSPERVKSVRSVTLTDLLEPHECVDLIHCDLQAAEADIFEEAARAVNSKVVRVHIGTHHAAVEARLRTLFEASGWRPVNDYPSGARSETPWGSMTFQDGVQTWTNPTIDGTHSSPRLALAP